MRRFIALSVMITVTLAVFSSCTQSDSRSKIVELQKTHDRLSQAMADQDAERVMSFIDPKAEFIDEKSHRTTADQQRGDFEKFFAAVKDHKVTCTFMDTRIDGAKAVVYADWDARYRVYYEKQKIWVPIILTARIDATWKKKRGAWKLTRNQTLHREEHIDPQWLAEYRKQNEMLAKYLDRAAASSLPCNLSYNGCR